MPTITAVTLEELQERIATGMRWAEGPVWFGDGCFLLWSDIPNNRIMRRAEETGAVSVFRVDGRSGALGRVGAPFASPVAVCALPQ